jgi:uncharacterized membrane protein YqgA involved in biofilm formation
MILAGTLLNVFTVAAGSLVGAFLGARIPERFSRVVFQAIGLFTVFIGVAMALKTAQVLIPVFSLILGSVAGEALGLEAAFSRLGDFIPAPVIAEMSATGGLMLLGLGFTLLEIKKIPVVNMLPALVVAAALAAVAG